MDGVRLLKSVCGTATTGRALSVALLFALLFPGCAMRCYKPYDVGKGETTQSVCSKFDMTPEDLKKQNHIEPGYELRPGDRIFIPCEQLEKKASTHTEAAKTPATPHASLPVKQSAGNKALKKETAAPTPSVRFAWPVEGVVVRGFTDGKDASGNGLDLQAPPGSPVRAAGDGKVEYASTPVNSYGPMILVSHADGFYTVYSRLGSISAKRGDTISQGRAIGTAGSEGYIHFEVRAGRKALDPVLYLPKR